ANWIWIQLGKRAEASAGVRRSRVASNCVEARGRTSEICHLARGPWPSPAGPRRRTSTDAFGFVHSSGGAPGSRRRGDRWSAGRATAEGVSSETNVCLSPQRAELVRTELVDRDRALARGFGGRDPVEVALADESGPERL